MRYVRGTAREADGRAWDNLHVINNETLGVYITILQKHQISY